ncbi:MAG: cysteine--tRNA ligase [Candidatus Methylomirabilales bacterium]
MALRIYNTLTRHKELFEPLTPGQVRMYACGVTAYDLCHMGHARSALVFDVIRRYFEFKGYRVLFVRNFTDVDDKIIKKANGEGVSASEVSERYIAEYRKDMDNLGVLPAEVEPKATEHIPQMIALIERLLARGFAYVVDGDVYFEVRRFPRYGRLSGKNLEELLVGARVEVDERKRDPRDFALWKASKPGEPLWESPWGPGRPGWHIECSAMSMAYLGESFDIHGGGEDLIFPHHESEIAQSEAGTQKLFARYWIHNGFVNFGKEKMSKSLGNILTIKELVKRHDPDALRLYLLGTHYRNPLDFGEDRLHETARGLERLRRLPQEAERLAIATPSGGPDGGLPRQVAMWRERFEAAMDDDFNTPQALGALFELSHVLYRYSDLAGRGERAIKPFIDGVETLVELCRVLGVLERSPKRPEMAPELREHITQLVAERDEARKQRDWTRADKLRAELQELGVTVEDTPSGTRWKWEGA